MILLNHKQFFLSKIKKLLKILRTDFAKTHTPRTKSIYLG